MSDDAAALDATTDEPIIENQPEQPEQQETALHKAAELKLQQEQPQTIPDKFVVKNDDGEIDYAASSAKLAQSYSYLEKKLGSGDAPPKTADEYNVTLSEDLGIDFNDLKADPGISQFVDGAHKLGMTDAQLSYVMDQYIKAVPVDLDAMDVLKADECIASLEGDYGAGEAQEILVDAYNYVTTFAGDDAAHIMNKIGNDPIILPYLAALGEGLREDRPPSEMQTIDPVDFSTQIADLTDQIKALPVGDPRADALLSKKDALYNRQYKEAI